MKEYRNIDAIVDDSMRTPSIICNPKQVTYSLRLSRVPQTLDKVSLASIREF